MAITQKVRVSELWFLCTALLHDVLYQCVKFQVESFYSFEIKALIKIQTENKQRRIPKKGGRVIVLVYFYYP